jgi:hypothetical protein
MERRLIFLIAAFCNTVCFGQKSYTSFLENDQSINWAAEYSTIVNLTPVSNTLSLKKYYLDRLRKDSVRSYLIEDHVVNGNRWISDKTLTRQDWLKDHYPVPSDRPERWEFRDRKHTGSGYRVSGFSDDECCGCDEADAFLVNQLLIYSHSKFTTRNIFLSPLCARRTSDGMASWHAMGKFAFNTTATRPATAAFLTSNTVTYSADAHDSLFEVNALTLGDPMIVDHLLKDLRTGKLFAEDPETGKKITYVELLTHNMPADTVEVLDIDMTVSSYQVVQRELDPSDIAAIRLEQDWYFDIKSEKLFSEVRSVLLMMKVNGPDGTLLGVRPFVKVRFK